LQCARLVSTGDTDQTLPDQISKPFPHKIRMRLLAGNTGAIFFGQFQASAIQEIPPKIRPGLTNSGLGRMNGTSLALEKKNAVAFFPAPDKKFAPPPDAPGSLELRRGNGKMAAKTVQIGPADDYAAPAFTAVPAKAAGETA
jgi:hypothetical protein